LKILVCLSKTEGGDEMIVKSIFSFFTFNITLISLLNCLCWSQTIPNCLPGWNGEILIDCDTILNWSVEQDSGASGSLAPVPGFISSAVELNWNLGGGDWVQAKYSFPQPADLSETDIFGVSLQGSNSPANRVRLMFADTNNVFFGIDCEGANLISRWMINLSFPKRMFYHFFTLPPNTGLRDIDWSQVNRFFVVVKKPDPASGGSSGFLTIDHLQADRAADWPRQAGFEAVAPDSLAAAKAVAYLLSRKKSSGLFQSWKEEIPGKAHLYDQALTLIALSREGLWQGGVPLAEAAQKADSLVDFLISVQKPDGRWARTWDPETGAELSDDGWVGDQAWWVMALREYSAKSGSAGAAASANAGADWLAAKIDPSGKVVPGTEGNVDVWWAMIASERYTEADLIQNYLLTEVWDPDLQYWWRGYGEYPDPVIAMDAATWVGEFAGTNRVNHPEMARAALSFVRRTLVTADTTGALCGFDGMGPVSVWCEGTAQFVSAGGEDAQGFLDMLLSLQRSDGGMPGSPEDWSGSCFGWLSTWSGIAPTAWMYFALTRSPFPADTILTINDRSGTSRNFELHQNYPNPFNPSTSITYVLHTSSDVTLKVYNLLGQEVKTLVSGHQSAGTKSAVWDGRDNPGNPVSSGMYVYKIEAGSFIRAHKMVLLR
jgi:hypothetical protein